MQFVQIQPTSQFYFQTYVKSIFVLNSTEYDARQFNKLDQQTQVEFETDSSVMAKKLLELEG